LVSRRPQAVNDVTAEERAFELASAGACATVGELVLRLRGEGYRTVRTDLRSVSLRRELKELCRARHTSPHAGE